jgi:hypothetical protein
LRFVWAVWPAAVCAAAMFLCFRMMRHSDMTTDADDLDTLRKEVADLRAELAQARSVRLGGAPADGVGQIVHREPSEPTSEEQPLDVRTSIGPRAGDGHPDG